jgi:hypothetical protein
MIQSHHYQFLLILHLVLSVGIAVISSNYLRERFKTTRRRVFAFIFLFNISLPIIGYIGSLWITYFTKYVQYQREIKRINFIDLELFEYNFVSIEREFGEGSIQDMLLNKYVPTEKKIKALVSLAENISQSNIQIIKNTLSSRDDEVRLYSFAIVDKIERDINSKIYSTLNHFKTTQDENIKASLARDLAFLYWELVYYELSDESLKEFLLKEVMHYIHIAQKKYLDDYKLCTLLGRVHMMHKEYELASIQFTLANEFSPNELAYIMPYLAEINFLTGHYSVVKSIINEASGLDLNSKLYPIVEQWRVS